MSDHERELQLRQLQDIARLASDGAQAARTRRKDMMLEDIEVARASINADVDRLNSLWDDIVICVAELEFIE